MKKNYLILFLLFAFSISSKHTSSAQVFNDLEAARILSLSENKLIIINFWATWCKPCLEMEEVLWKNYQYKAVLDEFVVLRVDVDQVSSLSKRFSVRSIPRVVMISAYGDVIYDQKGFSRADVYRQYVKVFEEMPKQTNRLNAVIVNLLSKKDLNDQDYFALGNEYGRVGRKVQSKRVRRSFLSISNRYLAKGEKNARSEGVAQMCKTYKLLNDAYMGRYNEVIKKVEQLEKREGEMFHFILAYCYLRKGEKEKYKQHVAQLTNDELKKELLP
ncbi:MAG: thioredoxin family protein [Thermonemataceae bacterium]